MTQSPITDIRATKSAWRAPHDPAIVWVTPWRLETELRTEQLSPLHSPPTMRVRQGPPPNESSASSDTPPMTT